MQDRVPVNPGRVLITPENGSAAYYATMTRADNATQEGTPLNKASLLKDATAALFGLGANAVPDDALNAIKTLIDGANDNANKKAKIVTGSYAGTGKSGSANPCSLTFDFAPKFIMFSIYWNGYYMSDVYNNGGGFSSCVYTDGLTTSYAKGFAPAKGEANTAYAKKSADGKTISWYNTVSSSGPDRQLNGSGYVYYYIAIG